MGFDLSRGFRKKFATFFLIFATRPLLSLVAGPALSLPSPRNRFATLCGGYWDSCIFWVSVRFVSVSTVLGGFRCQGSPLDCNHYTTLCGICQDLFLRFLTFFVRYCIAHNPLLLQPLGHWFTLVYRKREHLAVRSKSLGSRGKSYIALVGFPLRVASLNFCIYYSTLGAICQEVF